MNQEAFDKKKFLQMKLAEYLSTKKKDNKWEKWTRFLVPPGKKIDLIFSQRHQLVFCI